MKKKKACLMVCVLMVFAASLLFISGCETGKGMVRDVKSVDQWFRDHAW
jgi:predicted small secreted protein